MRSSRRNESTATLVVSGNETQERSRLGQEVPGHLGEQFQLTGEERNQITLQVRKQQELRGSKSGFSREGPRSPRQDRFHLFSWEHMFKQTQYMEQNLGDDMNYL